MISRPSQHHRRGWKMQQHGGTASGRSEKFQLQVEGLEERCLLSSTPALDTPDPATRARINAAYGQLPLSFEANQGQTDAHVNFLSRGAGYALFLTPDEAALRLQQPVASGTAAAQAAPEAVLRMQLVGANATPRVVGRDQLPGTSNYFIGNDPSRWHTDIPNYAQVEEQGVYPGVDLVYYGNQRQLEYDFTVAPGADPGVIRLAISGAESMTLDAQGNLVLHTAGGDVVEQAPVLYQEADGGRQAVSGHFVLEGDGQVGFAVGAYNPSKPLIIDPVLSYSTYLGGSGNDAVVGSGIAVDSAGNAYVTGDTVSTNFPTANPLQPATGGGDDAFVAKLNASGTALVYSTYLGGSGDDAGSDIAVDSAGNAYVTGYTRSTNFPTANPLQPTFGGDRDAFVAKLNASGTALVYSTYLGGIASDVGSGIAVDSAGNAYVTGDTVSTNFPTANPLQPASGGGLTDAFVAKLNATGTALVYSTYLGGSASDAGLDIAVDSAGNAYVTGNTSSTNFPTANPLQPASGGGTDAFVAKLNAAGTALVYSTYLGGSASDAGLDIAVDSAGNAYVTGDTSSTNFPTANPLQPASGGGTDAFVAKLNAAGTALVYSTYLGGSGNDVGSGIAVDSAGNAYVTGNTVSTNFPTANPLQPASGGGTDAFVAKLNAAGTALVYSTYFGGSASDAGRDIAVDSAGNAYVTGNTSSTNFPTANPLQPVTGGGTDAFVAKIAPVSTTTTALSSSSNPSVFGQAVTFTATVSGAAGSSGPPTGTVTFTIDGVAQPPVPLAVVNGVAQAAFPTSTLAGGNHTLTAAYSGDANFAASTSPPLTQAVNAPTLVPTTTQLNAQPNPSTLGQPVTFFAFVIPTTGTGTPTGTVTFTIDGVAQPPTAVTTQASSAAVFQLTTSALGLGTHTVTAAYSGDAMFSASTAFNPVTQVVNAPTAVDGPTVVSLQRFGFHAQPTLLVLTFSTPLDPARAGPEQLPPGGAETRSAVRARAYDCPEIRGVRPDQTDRDAGPRRATVPSPLLPAYGQRHVAGGCDRHGRPPAGWEP